MEDITDLDNSHVKRVCKDFALMNLGKYHDLYIQSDILFLADVFENICLEIYELDPAKFLFFFFKVTTLAFCSTQ